jgi:hypothetical protein
MQSASCKCWIVKLKFRVFGRISSHVTINDAFVATTTYTNNALFNRKVALSSMTGSDTVPPCQLCRSTDMNALKSPSLYFSSWALRAWCTCGFWGLFNLRAIMGPLHRRLVGNGTRRRTHPSRFYRHISCFNSDGVSTTGSGGSRFFQQKMSILCHFRELYTGMDR